MAGRISELPVLGAGAAGLEFEVRDPADLTESATGSNKRSTWSLLRTWLLAQGVDENALSLGDVATANVSTLRHGFVPKLPGDATKYLNGVGGWTTPAGGVGGGSLGFTPVRVFNVKDYGALGDGVNNDQSAIQAAINAAFAAGGGIVYFPQSSGHYKVAGPWNATYNALLYIPDNGNWVPGQGNPVVRIILQGEVGGGFSGNAIQTTSAIDASAAPNGSGTKPAVLSARAYAPTTILANFNVVQVEIDSLTLYLPNNPTFSGWNLYNAPRARVSFSYVTPKTAYANNAITSDLQQPTYGTSGIIMPGQNNNTLTLVEYTLVNGMGIGIEFSEHTEFRQTYVIVSKIGYAARGGGHKCHGTPSAEIVNTIFDFSGLTDTLQVNFSTAYERDMSGNWYSRTNELIGSPYLRGRIGFQATQSGTGLLQTDLLTTSGSFNPLDFYQENETSKVRSGPTALPRMTTAQRDALNPRGDQGLIIVNTTTNTLDWFNGSSWASAGAGGTVPPGFTDNFDDNTISGSPWSVGGIEFSPSNLVTVAETAGQLQITPPSSGVASNGYVTTARYSLVGRAFAARVVSVLNTSPNTDTNLVAGVDNLNWLRWICENGSVYAQYSVNGSVTTAGSIVYNAATHLWWRIRESGGTIYWDTSDGTTWTNRFSVASPFAVTSLIYALEAGTNSTNATPGTAKFDDASLQ